MNEEIDRLLADVREIDSFDLTHPELGTASGFRDAETNKEALVRYLDAVLTLCATLHADINGSVLADGVRLVREATNALRRDVAGIEATVLAGIHTPQFVDDRRSYINAVAEHKKQFETAIHPFELALRVAELGRLVRTPAFVSASAEADAALTQIRRASAEIEKALATVRDRFAAKGIDDAQSAFGRLASDHAGISLRWFWAFLAAISIVLLAVGWAAATPTLSGSAAEVTASIFRKLLVISTSAALLRLCLGKYNAERNLKVIYEHRRAVLNQYKIFEAAIGDDPERRAAKDAFRIEVAKYIFTDPATGYVSAEGAADININPVIATVERFLPK